MPAVEQPVQDEIVETSTPAKSPISLWRAIILGILLVQVNVWWVTIEEVRWYDMDGTELPLFVTPVVILFLLVLVNLACRKFLPQRSALRQEEMLLIYIMLVISCTFAGGDTLQYLFGSVSYPYWYATPNNNWQQLFFRFLPKWLFVTDHNSLSALYRGNVNIYDSYGRHYLISWIVPLAAWGAFFLTLFGMYLCINILIRRAWIDNEKLTFPTVQLPIAMTSDDAGTFFKTPMLRTGFLLAFCISGLNGLHTLYPSLPHLNIGIFQLQPYFTTPPWSSIGSTLSSFYPFAIGLFYFMPLDLSLSCWAFFILARAFRIIGNVYGLDLSGSAFPFFAEQATGAWFGLGFMLIYAARNYWKIVFKTVRDGSRSDDPAEAVQYRASLIGLVIGMVLLAIFSAVIGMSPWVTLVFYLVLFLLGFVITRVRAEFGAPHEIYFVNPGQVLVTVFGTHEIGPQNLTLISTLYWFNRCYRNHPMPNQLEALKMMDNRPAVRFGGTIGIICLAAIVSLLATYWANLQVSYSAGASAKAIGFKFYAGSESFGRLQSWLTTTQPSNGVNMDYMAGGFILVVILSLLRINFDWWPLHPAGYALAISYAMEYFWLPVFIAWLAKFVILRYGGVKLYRTMIPFFLGLILGDYTCGALWAIIGPLIGVQTYKIFLTFIGI